LRFIAIADEDRQGLKSLLTRLRSRGAQSISHPFPQLERL
jgi:hypothetical protein